MLCLQFSLDYSAIASLLDWWHFRLMPMHMHRSRTSCIVPRRSQKIKSKNTSATLRTTYETLFIPHYLFLMISTGTKYTRHHQFHSDKNVTVIVNPGKKMAVRFSRSSELNKNVSYTYSPFTPRTFPTVKQSDDLVKVLEVARVNRTDFPKEQASKWKHRS